MYRAGERPVEDLTARARIVDAALDQFASSGSGATMRSIADAAGVSVGLVQHHFGTKNGLRRACDERVLALVRLKVANIGPDGRLTDPEFLWSLYDAAVPVMPYVARVTLEADERAAALFDEVAALCAAWMTTQWPERFLPGSDRTRDAAAVMTTMNMSTLVMHHQLVRSMDLEADEPIPSPRIGNATFEVYQAMGEFLASSYGAELRNVVGSFSEAEIAEHRETATRERKKRRGYDNSNR